MSRKFSLDKPIPDDFNPYPVVPDWFWADDPVVDEFGLEQHPEWV